MDKLKLQNVAEIKLSYSTKIKASERMKVQSSQDAEKVGRLVWENDMEHIESMKLILLNRANKVLGVANLSIGGTAGTVCDPKVVFQYAIKGNASSIILVHNHPSGNREPSNADKNITNQVKSAGQLLSIQLLDHIILTPYDGYYSFADDGQL